MRVRAIVRAIAAFACCLISCNPGAAHPIDRWVGEMAEASARFGIPTPWIRKVMLVESGGRTHRGGVPIRSSAGALGLMQVMPGTWRAMRAAHGLGADPHTPRDNILAGTAYMRAMYDRFGYPGLFGAYNAGPGRYADHLARGTRLPGETVAYMARIAGRQRPLGPAGGEAEAARRMPQSGYASPASDIFLVREASREASGTAPPALDARLFYAQTRPASRNRE